MPDRPQWFQWLNLGDVIAILKVVSHTHFALRSMLQNTFDDKSTLIQAMAWCHQETNLKQC